MQWLANFHQLQVDNLEPHLYQLPKELAVKHAFRVASGLDSMVLGEPQILGQFKSAVRAAESAGTLGLLLNKLFQRTFSVAKVVRSETDIGASTVSMASGNQVTLNIGGNALVDVTTDKGTLNALVENKGAIVADGGNEQRTIAHVVAEGVTRKPGHARASSSARLAQELKLSASSRCSVNRATTRST